MPSGCFSLWGIGRSEGFQYSYRGFVQFLKGLGLNLAPIFYQGFGFRGHGPMGKMRSVSEVAVLVPSERTVGIILWSGFRDRVSGFGLL